jgi:PTH1 family peptidyl-tRNA hydrolase
MNLSGRAVRHIMQFYKISIGDVLVVCDDLNLPLGAVRLRAKGSDGGQNGLKNIIAELGRNDFARFARWDWQSAAQRRCRKLCALQISA